MINIPGIKPYVVLFTRKGGSTPTNHLTTQHDTEGEARESAGLLCPDSHTFEVYELTAVKLPPPRPDHHSRAELLARNGRWGTCVDCPRDAKGRAFPEQCKFTNRYDHNLSSRER